MNLGIYEPFAISLGLGLLVGLQRQWKGSDIAGIRTFPLLSLMGTTVATVAGDEFAWLTAAGLLGIAVLLVIANVTKIRDGELDPGMTTEVAALLMYVIGVAVAGEYLGPAIVVAGVTAVLLHWKGPLHGFVERIGKKDIRGLIHLVLIALVILPLLPNETFGPYDVFNPYKIWLMVVLIVGISMVAYVAYKLLGASIGAVLGGVLGGLISSTATTVSYARQTKGNASLSSVAALVILLASTIVNVRVLVEVGLVAPTLLKITTLPLLIMLGVMVIESVVVFFLVRKDTSEPPDHDNPAQLKPAIIFGILYAVILLVVAWAKDMFGTQALYVVAMISGLTDVDAITLSTAQLFKDGRVEASVAWRVILIATLSNLVFKAAAVAMLGSRRLTVYVGILFGIAFAAGLALLLLWPDISIKVPTQMFENSNSAQHQSE